MNVPTCTACNSPMQEGFLIDRYGESQKEAVVWASGSFWSYMLGRERAYPVTTWRCPECGLLHSYAGVVADSADKDHRGGSSATTADSSREDELVTA